LTKLYVPKTAGRSSVLVELTIVQWADADKKAGKVKSQTESYVKDAKAEAIKAVDKFDKTVEDGAAKAKSGVSSWFGGSK
jgi:hypothetical protein